MKIFKNIVAVVSVAFGILFLVGGGSDIQFGFGVTLTVIGLLAIQK